MKEGATMKSTEAEDQITRDDHRPAFDCDVSVKDGGDDMCVREYLRTHIPVLV
jgi:hypothetical protein